MDEIKINMIEKTDEGLVLKLPTTSVEQVKGLKSKLEEKVDNSDLISFKEENKIELNKKVDKVSGKGLSTNDFTDVQMAKISQLDEEQGFLFIDIADLKRDKADKTYVDKQVENKVDKVEDKGLSTYDFNSYYRNKVMTVDDKADKTYVDEQVAQAGKVKSVNGKTGSVVLKASDIRTDSGYFVEAAINNKADKTDVDNKIKVLTDGKIDKTSITSDLAGTDETKVLSQKAGSLLEDAIKNIDLSGKIDKSAITDDFNGTDIAKVLSQKGANDLLKALGDDSLFDFTKDKDISILKIKGKKESFCILTHHGTLKPESTSNSVFYRYPIGFKCDTRNSPNLKLQMVGSNNKRFYFDVFSSGTSLIMEKTKNGEPLDDCFDSFVYIYKCSE